MTTRCNSSFQAALLIGSVLMVAACSTGTTTDAIKNGESIAANQADSSARAAIEKGKPETPPELHPTGSLAATEPNTTAPPAAAETTQAPRASATRINHKERYVNVRSAPSAKSRVLAVLRDGHSVEVVETRDGWVKIAWHRGKAVHHGWMKNVFVAGYEP